MNFLNRPMFEFNGEKQLIRSKTQLNGVVTEEFYDQEGRTIRVVTTSPEGKVTMVEHSYHPNGAISSEYIQDQNGEHYEEFSEEGNLIYRKTEEANGEAFEVYYYDNGEVASRTVKVDDTETISKYQENGNLVSEKITHANGDGQERNLEYNENGKLVYEKTTFTNGRLIEITYHANGQIASENILGNDGTNDITRLTRTYDDTGFLLTLTTAYTDGTQSAWTYFADGHKEEYYTDADGTVWYSWIDAAGVQIIGPKKVN